MLILTNHAHGGHVEPMHVFNKKRFSNDLFRIIQEYQDKSGLLRVTDDFRHEIERTIQSSHYPDHIAETKNFSILLSDLRGFSSIAEKFSPTLIIELLNHYFSTMSAIIDRHGGVIDKFMGDSIMVLFSEQEGGGTDLKATIQCAIEMQIAMNDINVISENLGLSKLYMGIGINTGEVVAGTLGSDIHREYTVIGDEVNLASRLEAQSLRGQILLSHNTFELAKDFIDIGTVNEVFVKGKAKPVKMYDLMAITEPQRLEVPQREIRTSPRIAVNIPLTFFSMDGKKVLEQPRNARVIDISYGGLFMVTNNPIEAFSELKMSVSLSLMGEGTSEIYARVLNCQKVNDGYESNVEFTSLDDQARLSIKSFVDSQL